MPERVQIAFQAGRMVTELPGIHAQIGNHTFRATGITAYLENGGQLEHAQTMARMKARARRSSTTAQRIENTSLNAPVGRCTLAAH
ncbi:MAG: hypothetical protein K0R61_4607 [Microvirga sp.]|nr:hypothetical protein [Microvirga sp.]